MLSISVDVSCVEEKQRKEDDKPVAKTAGLASSTSDCSSLERLAGCGAFALRESGLSVADSDLVMPQITAALGSVVMLARVGEYGSAEGHRRYERGYRAGWEFDHLSSGRRE